MSQPKENLKNSSAPSEQPKEWSTGAKMLLVFLATVVLFAAVWFVRLRPEQERSKQKTNDINSFEECVAAGNPVQESYPPVCVTSDHQRFVGPR